MLQYSRLYQSTHKFKDVLKNTEYPYCCVGLLDGPTRKGTAFLIGPNILLTCSHNILHKAELR